MFEAIATDSLPYKTIAFTDLSIAVTCKSVIVWQTEPLASVCVVSNKRL